MSAMNGRPALVAVSAALAVNDAQSQGEDGDIDKVKEQGAFYVSDEGVVVVHIGAVQEAEVIGDFAFFLVGGYGGGDVENGQRHKQGK